ncbi:ABC transporter substrate-binding protein [Sporomusa acidovorans]|uniref:Fe/B12 periplasmic-binding domain-containing protein n=1 Tax=Sporomusa acidovorans (strain ATCC 49682 / DSM 3132 / Mol) TaxID=1123286 RepID=A0ABZ3IXP6_SPOA4|nr:ABC transporter substrate-binding protein [Sporomusa acidovorans]OZC22199.1 Fe(3+)-citrate-binding protein YfmC precursor [Sporomusa acidovorans DSM 3132]SDE81727.1 iron complex transport system substrate-binding protein [Sporomusa acidovorans]
MAKNVIWIGLAIILAGLFVTGCGRTETAKQQAVSGSAAGATIKDSTGREIKIPAKLQRVIVLNSSTFNVITAIGAADAVIGVNDSTQQTEPAAAKLAVFGTFRQPNVEKIIEARPDAVLGTSNINPAQVKQLEDAGITVLFFELYLPSILQEEIFTLGKLFNKEAEAQKYADFIMRYQQLIEDRVKDINPQDKATVYFEGYGDYSTVAKGTGGDELVNRAGGINIAGQENVKYPKVSAEWVLQKKPRVIVKTVSSNSRAMGEGYTDRTAVKAVYDKVISRPGWNELAAVKNNKVILLAQDIGTTPEGSIIGMLYMVKTMYPDRFSDIDPYEIYKQMKKEFYHVAAKGIIIYP